MLASLRRQPSTVRRKGTRSRQAGTTEQFAGKPVGTLERIWLKRGTGGPMDPVDAAVLDVDRGLLGNANRSRRRQVTIISRERWTELMIALGADLEPECATCEPDDFRPRTKARAAACSSSVTRA